MPRIDQPSAMKTGDLSEWGRPIWILLSPLSFEREGREPIIVPAGFKTDFASVLRLPFMFWLFGDTAHASAVVHDWLVEQKTVSWRRAADIFLEAMKAEGVGLARRTCMYWAVRLADPSNKEPSHV